MSEREGGFELENEDSGPTIQDKINYSFLVGRAILAFIYNETRAGDYDEYAVASAAMTVRSLIPTSMEDEQFKMDVSQATYTEIEDNRSLWCGVRTGELNETNSRRVVHYDPHRLLRACVDLLNRNHLLAKSVPMEKIKKILGRGQEIELGGNVE